MTTLARKRNTNIHICAMAKVDHGDGDDTVGYNAPTIKPCYRRILLYIRKSYSIVHVLLLAFVLMV